MGDTEAARASCSATDYQVETLNFDSPAAFFGQLTERRWALIHTLQAASGLVNLGIFERTASGGVRCPYADIHVDLHLRHAG